MTPYDYLSFGTDSDGSFNFEAVPAGAYRLLAIDDWELEYSKPNALRSYLVNAREIDVLGEAKQEVRIDLK